VEGGLGQAGEQIAGAGRRDVGELPLPDEEGALGSGIEGLTPETSRRVQCHEVGVVVGNVPQVRGRVQQGDDAARGVVRAGARAVQPPPGPRLQELRHETRLRHK